MDDNTRYITLQWHLSEACNLRCKHCYQENHVPVQLPYEDLLKTLNQYRKLLKETGCKGHINLTGGEPLFCPHLFKLLDEFKKDKDLYSFAILTNGTLLTDEIAKKIASYNPWFIQVSLEGGKKTNDFVRGEGTYEKIGEAIKLLRKYGIWVSVSFTATKLNYKEYPTVVDYVEEMGGSAVWSDRYIPLGDQRDQDFIMNLEETQEWMDIMFEKRKQQHREGKKTIVSMQRALQFSRTGEEPYECTAGWGLLTVMENGDIVPCRRMPIVVGNIHTDEMIDLYRNHPVLLDLKKATIPKECIKCKDANACRGGLKCLTYALTKSYKLKDQGCDR